MGADLHMLALRSGEFWRHRFVVHREAAGGAFLTDSALRGFSWPVALRSIVRPKRGAAAPRRGGAAAGCAAQDVLEHPAGVGGASCERDLRRAHPGDDAPRPHHRLGPQVEAPVASAMTSRWLDHGPRCAGGNQHGEATCRSSQIGQCRPTVAHTAQQGCFGLCAGRGHVRRAPSRAR